MMSRRAVSRTLCVLLLCGETAAQGSIVISEFDVTHDKVELVNLGDELIDISSFWWANRVGTSVANAIVYNSSTIDTNLSTSSTFTIRSGEVLVLDLHPEFLPDEHGELALYSSNAFADVTSLVDYVLWGGNGVRDTVASAAGIWEDNGAIEVNHLAPHETVQLLQGLGVHASQYGLRRSTLGIAQAVPEPSSLWFMIGLTIAQAYRLGKTWLRKQHAYSQR